jgi:hypothetical protein
MLIFDMEYWQLVAIIALYSEHYIREELAKYADILADLERPTKQRVEMTILPRGTNN